MAITLHPLLAPLPPVPARLLLPKPPDPPQWMMRLAMGCARRNIAGFRRYPDVGLHDLFQLILLKMMKGLRNYRDDRGVPRDAFLAICGRRAVIELLRAQSSRAQAVAIAEAQAREEHHETPAILAGGPAVDHDDPLDGILSELGHLPPSEFARAVVHRLSSRMGTQPHGRGRPRRYSPAQIIACELLRRRIKASRRGLIQILRTEKLFREALGVRKPPSVLTVRNMERELLVTK